RELRALSERCRFAPSPSGPAHPGTLLAALLCWLDARSRGAWLLLRLEDVDPTRCTPERARDLRAALDWLGLDWDAAELKGEQRAAQLAALRALPARGRTYACRCSRADLRSAGLPAADGGWRHPESCRERRIGPDEVERCADGLRLRLEDGIVEVADEGGE